jgi:hypothetical protein
MATIHTADGRRRLREGEIARELVRKEVELSRKDAELSLKDLELAELRRLMEALRGSRPVVNIRLTSSSNGQ